MALEGTLRDFSLADILQLIGLQRKTGVLTLRGKDDTVTVTFLDGKVVGADSLNRRLETRLGNVLIRTGMLRVEQLGRALEIQKETLQRLGFILTHYGIISQDTLREAIQLQIMQVIYRLFRWKDGDYHFSQETTIEYDLDNVVPITAESILMEGARMIDEWPIIEKRIRSYDMVFRKKEIAQEIVVVGADEADEIDFDESSTHRRKRPAGQENKIRISREESSVYDMANGTNTVGDIVEMSRLNEFDTNKALYELHTRDLIEEVREAAPSAESVPFDELAVAETPVSLVLALFLALLAALSLATMLLNPLNGWKPLARRTSSLDETKKAVSMQRIQHLGRAIEQFNLANGHLPAKLTALVPFYVSPNLLEDPWGNAYAYLQQQATYHVIGFSPDTKADTDLILSHSIDLGPSTSTPSRQQQRGGIELIPD